MIFNFNKPRSISSNGYLQWLKKKFSFSKAGFLGTLDPLADGVLPVFCGQDTKLIELFENHHKKYRFTMQLGWQSASLDSEIQVVAGISPRLISTEEINEAFAEFRDYLQQPPIYSAIQINGKAAYRLARKSLVEEKNIPARRVKILNFKLIANHADRLTFELTCSKGFYIRSLVRDLADYFKQNAVLIKLTRLAVGDEFKLEDSWSCAQLLNQQNLTETNAVDWQKIFINFPKIKINDQQLIKNICNGRKIKLNISDDLLKEMNYNKDIDNCLIHNNKSLIAIANVAIQKSSATEETTSKSNNIDKQGNRCIITPQKCFSI